MYSRVTLLLPLVLGLSGFALSGQAPSVSKQTNLGPVLYQVSPDRFVLKVATMTYDKRPTAVRFLGTERLPGARGDAKVQQKDGVTEIEVELSGMKPGWSFGGDFNTYVLWAVSPEGHTDNLGEFILSGNHSRLNVSTRVDAFGLIVTAEPHFMVDHPSPFVVLVNIDPKTAMRRPTQVVELNLVAQNPGYRFERESLRNAPRVNGEVWSALRQAQVAVQRAIGTGRLTPDQVKEVQESLNRAEGAAETRSPRDPDVEMMARRTVRLAVAAEKRTLPGDGLP
jgi:hypothetical protein